MIAAGRVSTILALAASTVVTSACDVSVDAQGFTSHDEKQFTVSGTPELTLATFDGPIEVRAWDRRDVQVVIERRAQTRDEANGIEIKAEQSGTRITIEARAPRLREHRIGFGFHIGRSVKLIASVPRTTNLLARSGDGSIVAEGLEGRIELRTGDGAVTADDLKGQIRIHTGDGNVKLAKVDGAVDLDTSDGSIAVDGRLTALRARSGDGRIVIRARTGSTMREGWDVTTGDGSIDIDLPDNFNAELDAHTGDGSIDLSRVPLAATAEVRRETVRGTIGSGGERLKLRSGDGSIRLKGAMQAERTDQK